MGVGAFISVCVHIKSKLAHASKELKMETDRIRMESDSNSTFYHILNRIRIRIWIFSDTNAKRMPRIRIRIWILT